MTSLPTLIASLMERQGRSACLFVDLDGTLVDTNHANFRAYQAAIREVTDGRFDVHEEKGRRFNREALRKGLPRLGDADIDRIIAIKPGYYERFLADTRLNSDLVGVLKALSPSNSSILVTGSEEGRAKLTLSYHGVLSLFTQLEG